MQRQIHEDTVRRMHPGQLLQNYLLSSFCYYELDQSPMTDNAFDLMCKLLHGEFDNLVHPHKHLTNKESLEAGTLLLARDKYPRMIGVSVDAYMLSVADGSFFTRIEPHLKNAA